MEKEPSAVVNLVAYADDKIAMGVELFHKLLETLQDELCFEQYCVMLDLLQAELNFNAQERFGNG